MIIFAQGQTKEFSRLLKVLVRLMSGLTYNKLPQNGKHVG